MVFSSIPRLYLDPPNWQPQLGSSNDNSQLPPSLPPPPPVEGGSGQSLTSPVSMTDRARLAKLPQPEIALKCPRCDSTNTKFCYFNNYSLSQPRHFCKTCRRYWTRGGALRNVPVGGGCRRNKRTKGSRSKSPVTAEHQLNGNCSSNSTTPVSSSSCTTDFISHYAPHQPLQLPFMPSLHHVTDFGAGGIGFNFGSDSAEAGVELPIGGSSSGRFCEQWRLQQFNQLSFSEPPPGNYEFDHNDGVEPSNYIGGAAGQFGSKAALDSGISQLGAVKSEENQGGVNLSRNFLGMNGNDEYWGGNININAWTTNLNVFTPSTTSHLL